jgi:prepilin-type N-terminal cleavage/methylation domain-containing protein
VRGRVRSRFGFTMIEMLVATVVIMVLAGLLMPTFHLVSMRAHDSKCQSHLRRIFMATQLYSDHWSGYAGAGVKQNGVQTLQRSLSGAG